MDFTKPAFSFRTDCGTNWAMAKYGSKSKELRPLDRARLEQLTLHYVGRYATTRKKLHDYLIRKIRERGWEDDSTPPIIPIIERMAALGYVNDRQFADSRARSLSARGYGPGRVKLALHVAGISEDDGRDAIDTSIDQARHAAVRFAKRKKLGPFSTIPVDRDEQRRAIATMCRAGHDLSIAQEIILRHDQFVQDEDVSML